MSRFDVRYEDGLTDIIRRELETIKNSSDISALRPQLAESNSPEESGSLMDAIASAGEFSQALEKVISTDDPAYYGAELLENIHRLAQLILELNRNAKQYITDHYEPGIEF